MTDDDYTPSERDVREVWVDDRISRDLSRYPHGEAHVPELEREFDRFIAQVRADAGAQALRDAADDLAVQANEPGLIERAGRYQGYYAGVRSAMQDAETKLRARADTITQEDTP